MATLSVRLEDPLHRRVEEAAEASGVSISEWVRQLIVERLGLDDPDAWSAPTTLSNPDRLQLSAQFRLLGLMTSDEDESEEYERLVEVLERGFTGEYGNVFASIHDELPISECRLVWDILDMFRVIRPSVERLEPDRLKKIDELAKGVLRFDGFDFNDAREIRLAIYARFLVESGRWSELAVHFDAGHEHGNSHHPNLDKYLRMLEVFTPIWERKIRGIGRGSNHLSEDELREIVLAAYHPSRQQSTTGNG
jgi:uncharacterized protein YfbU (UPF0304 family)